MAEVSLDETVLITGSTTGGSQFLVLPPARWKRCLNYDTAIGVVRFDEVWRSNAADTLKFGAYTAARVDSPGPTSQGGWATRLGGASKQFTLADSDTGTVKRFVFSKIGGIWCDGTSLTADFLEAFFFWDVEATKSGSGGSFRVNISYSLTFR